MVDFPRSQQESMVVVVYGQALHQFPDDQPAFEVEQKQMTDQCRLDETVDVAQRVST